MFSGLVQLLEPAAQQISGELSVPTPLQQDRRLGQLQHWGTGTEMGFGPREAPGRCAQHLSKGAASSPLQGRMGLGSSFGEL